jgi:hypothetical protein
MGICLPQKTGFSNEEWEYFIDIADTTGVTDWRGL